MTNYIVKEKDTLFTFLRKNVQGKSKNNIKSLLKNKCIKVNNIIITKYDYSLTPGDTISIGNINEINNNTLNIIYEDEDIIVIDKKSKLLTISNSREKEKTLYREVSNYLKKKHTKVFIIHRLDYDTSGVIIFAKNQTVQEIYQKNWNNLAKKREYTAIVEGITPPKGHIESYLKQTKTLHVYSSKNQDGLFSITDYQRVSSNDKYSLLKIHISTGRRNQIRCHMFDIGHPIAGDNRYGSKTNPLGRLALHANSLIIENPKTHKIMTFNSPIPSEFFSLFKTKR